MLGEPICVRTLSNHWRGPLRCSSIQQGVLVTVWRLQNTKKESTHFCHCWTFSSVLYYNSRCLIAYTVHIFGRISRTVMPALGYFWSHSSISEDVFSKVFGARNTTRTIHSPVGIPLPEAVRNMSTPHFIPPSLLHACCILPPLLQSHSYTIPHHLLFLLKVGFSQQPKVMFFFFYFSLLQLWMKMFNNLFGIMCIHLCNKFYNGFNCPHVSQTEGNLHILFFQHFTA